MLLFSLAILAFVCYNGHIMIKEAPKREIPRRKMSDEQFKELATEAFQSLTIQDDFMFATVMQDEAICLKVLNILLKGYFRIGSIKLAITEKTIKNHPELKFVRLDVLAMDEADNSYDIEMQVVNRKNIGKRMRSYQVAIDMFKMQKGMDYNALTNTMIIFITPFDPFGAGLPVYFFEQFARGNPSIKMDDGSYKVIFNTRAFEDVEDETLRELLKFFHTGKATSGVAKEIEMKMEAIKRDSVIFAEFLPTFMKLKDAKDEGKKEGWLEGIAKGSYEKAIDTAKKCLAMNMPIETIAEITGLTKEEILKS